MSNYMGNLADQLMQLRRKSRVSNMQEPSNAMLAGITRGYVSDLGNQTRADKSLGLEEDRLGLAKDQLSWQKENAANQLAWDKENAANTLAYNRSRSAMQDAMMGTQLKMAQDAQPSGLNRVLSTAGQLGQGLMLNNLAGNPLGKTLSGVGNLVTDPSGFLFNLFGGGDSIFL